MFVHNGWKTEGFGQLQTTKSQDCQENSGNLSTPMLGSLFDSTRLAGAYNKKSGA